MSVQPIECSARLRHQELAVLVDDAHRLVPEARRGGAVPPENVGFLEKKIGISFKMDFLKNGGAVPPLVDVALFIELLPLVVKPVGDLVPDHHPYPAKVERLGEVLVVEGGLEDAGREHDLVAVPAVVGVHHRWRRRPDRPVDGLPEHCHLPLSPAVQVGQHVLKEFLLKIGETLDLGLQLLVTQHQVWIANVVDHRIQFAPVERLIDGAMNVLSTIF